MRVVARQLAYLRVDECKRLGYAKYREPQLGYFAWFGRDFRKMCNVSPVSSFTSPVA